jgi:hypothetical protein
VEIDDQGKVVRSVSNAEIDRIVSTNSSMHDADIFSGVTHQVWRLSDLKRLKTSFFDVGDNRCAHISPEDHPQRYFWFALDGQGP